MRRFVLRMTVIALVGFVAPLCLAGAASAQYREFTGKVDKISKSKVIIDNRMGDKVTFSRLKETEVEDISGGDRPKKTWKDIKKGDWVTVHWKMIDKPRKAYKMVIVPDHHEAGEDL